MPDYFFFFSLHCSNFVDHHDTSQSTIFNAFLLAGLYQSLRHNYFVHKHDMDAAITSICQETMPLEVDMTSFLLSSCGHMQKLVSQARKELSAAKEVDLGRKHSVRFLEVLEIQRLVDTVVSFRFVGLPTCNHSHCL